MITVQFPFNIENSDMQSGFEEGKNPDYQSIKPASDAELITLIEDFFEDGKDRLAHNIGFLFGLFQPDEPTGGDSLVSS